MNRKFSRRLAQTAALTAFALSTPMASAASTIVFSDNFDDGSVADWVKSTNYGGMTAVTTRTDSVVSPGHALFANLDVPPGGTNLIVRASHEFLAPVAADYSLELSARSTPCQGCTISYDILVDGVLLSRSSQPESFEARSFTLSNLAAGAHTLTLGMHTTNVSSGRFSASFDDVAISTTSPVPEPRTAALFLAGLGLLTLCARQSRVEI